MNQFLHVDPRMIEFDQPKDAPCKPGDAQQIEATVRNNGQTPLAFKIYTNRSQLYAVMPNRGMLRVNEQMQISFKLNRGFTKRMLEQDSAERHHIRFVVVECSQGGFEVMEGEFDDDIYDEWNDLFTVMSHTRKDVIVPITYKHTDNTDAKAKGADKSAVAVDQPLTECSICWEAKPNSALDPCGHVCMCLACATNQKAQNKICPVCRTPIAKILKIYQ